MPSEVAHSPGPQLAAGLDQQRRRGVPGTSIRSRRRPANGSRARAHLLRAQVRAGVSAADVPGGGRGSGGGFAVAGGARAR